jgi:branched-chain amino acid aminotransferase
MVSFDQITWMWSNGEFVEWRDASVHVSTHTFHLGSGVFEALRCYETNNGSAVFRLDAHLDRLFASASIHSIDIPYTHDELSKAVLELIRYNDFSSCYIRMLVYHGVGSLGVMPHNCPVEVAILAWPFGAYLGSHALEHGVRVTISPWVKFSSRMMPTTAKACGQYLNSLLAVRAAIKEGYDEAILLNEAGTIAEGSGENIFLVRDGRVITNDEDSSILLGITRDAVIRIARDLGYNVDISPIRVEDLLSADEAFFTGTAAEVTPIREVDGKHIGAQERGPITHAIQQAFFNATSGKDPRYQHWLQNVRQPAAAAVLF